MLHPEPHQHDVLAGMWVLLAGDHALLLQLTCDALARAGMLTTAADGGQIAVALVASREFYPILLDQRMPLLPGDQAAEEIRRGAAHTANAKIIGLTAQWPP